MTEIWLPIVGWPYEVSSFGRVRSFARGERILRPWLSRGYPIVSLQYRGEKLYIKVHRLVFEAFRGKIPSDLTVNHIDGNKQNNRPENLELLTPAENKLHAKRTGLLPTGAKHWARRQPHLVARGERNGHAKITDDDVRAMHEMRASGALLSHIAARFKIDASGVSEILAGKRWAHVKRPEGKLIEAKT